MVCMHDHAIQLDYEVADLPRMLEFLSRAAMEPDLRAPQLWREDKWASQGLREQNILLQGIYMLIRSDDIRRMDFDQITTTRIALLRNEECKCPPQGHKPACVRAEMQVFILGTNQGL